MHASFAAAILVPLLILVSQDGADSSPSNEKLAKIHSGNCANCHQPPDTRFAVDRAWITQLSDTA